MNHQPPAHRDELIRAVRKAVAEAWTQFDTDQENWGPLEAALPTDELAGFMWMHRTQLDGQPIEVYRHVITRQWLHLAHNGTAYWWSERTGYQPLPIDEAIEIVFEGLGEASYTRHSSGADYLAERDAQAAAHGWTVIS